MDSLHCYICFQDEDHFGHDFDVSLNTFETFIKDIRCNYQVITQNFEDYTYFYAFFGPHIHYLGCCSSWLTI